MITFHEAQKLAASRLRVQIVKKRSEGDLWLQPVLQVDDAMLCVVSSATGSRVLKYGDPELEGYRVARPGGTYVAPLDLGMDVEAIRAKHDGHNGIAEAALLLASLKLPCEFGYNAPRKPMAVRHVDLTWANGELFGGEDNDRGGARRSFRLDRVDHLQLCRTATSYPQWTGNTYMRGMP